MLLQEVLDMSSNTKRKEQKDNIVIVQQFKASESLRKSAYIEKMAKAITATEQRKILL